MGLESNGAMSDLEHIGNGTSYDLDMADLDNLTPLGLDKEELVRLLVQAADSLGYEESARKLEQDSGICAMSEEMRRMRECLLEGRWDELEQWLPDDEVFKSEESAAMARFRIYEQKFLETLEAGDVKGALDCMRNQLSKWCRDEEQLHKLSLLFMCTTPEDLRQTAKWQGAGRESRLKVLDSLRSHIPSSVLLQENRLEHLLTQVLDYQKRVAMYPFTNFVHESLLEDLQFCPQRVPRVTIHELKSHTDEVWFVQFSHSGKYLASASKDKTVIVWDMDVLKEGGQEVAARRFWLEGHTDAISYLAWSPDDNWLLSCGEKDGTIRKWSMKSGECQRVFEKHTGQITACAWMPDSRHFISGGHDKQIYEWDSESGEAICWATTVERVNDLGITKDGKRLIVITADKKIHVFDTAAREILFAMKESESPSSLFISKDSSYLLVNLAAQGKSEMHIWNLKRRRLVKKIRGYTQLRYVIRGAFGGHKDMFIVCGSEDKKVYLWHRDSKTALARLEGHSATVNCVSWSETDWSMFASASDDKTVRVWGVDEDPDILEEGPDVDVNEIQHSYATDNADTP